MTLARSTPCASGPLPLALLIDGGQQVLDVLVLLLLPKRRVDEPSGVTFAVAELAEDFEGFADDVGLDRQRSIALANRARNAPVGYAVRLV